MSDLRSGFTEQLKAAMKSGDSAATGTLRLILAKLKDVDLAARTAGREAGNDGEILSMLQGMIKQRQESAKIYRENNRPELADKEDAEIKVIERFLPKQLSDDEAGAKIMAIIAETGAAGVKDMGKVMAAVKEKLAGQMDMSKASALVKQKLAG